MEIEFKTGKLGVIIVIMKYGKLLLINLLIFIFVLFLMGCLSIIANPEFHSFVSKTTSQFDIFSDICRQLIDKHAEFVVLSLLLTFIIIYGFADLELFKGRNFKNQILISPFILSILIFAFEVLFQCEISNIRISHIFFACYMVIPIAICLNYRPWYLKTAIYSFIIFLLVFKLNNALINYIGNLFSGLNIEEKLKIPKFIVKYISLSDIILSGIYFIGGIYLFKLSNYIQKFWKRIDIGKIKKIQR